MQRHNDVSRQSTLLVLRQLNKTGSQRRASPLATAAVLVLALATLACAVIGSGFRSASDRIVIGTHLPTLTRTPLPTFTATAIPTLPAVAMSTEPTATLLTFAPLPNHDKSSPAATLPEETTSGSPEIAAVNPSATPADLLITGPGTPSAPVTDTPATAPTATATETLPPTSTSTATATKPIVEPSPFHGTPNPPTSTPTATATKLPPPTSTPTEIPSPTPFPEGWVFSGVWLFPGQDAGNLMVHGDVINNTGLAQQLALITGTFYDGQGQVIADGNTSDYWPIGVISQGGRVPFELIVPGLQSAASVDLRVEAKPGGDTPRQDFEFLDLATSTEGDDYCLTGKVRNPGDPLRSYLVIVAVLYDSQDNVINYYDYYDYSPQALVGEQTTDFKICVNSLNQQVARYEPRAWGL